MNKRSMSSYIGSNDLEGAYERYLETSPSWEARWWSTVEAIYNSCSTWADKYIIDPVKRTLTKIVNSAKEFREILFRKFRDGRSVPMIFMKDCGENISGEQAVYFFKFFNKDGLEFNKIGTTAKDVVKRLRDEIGDYSKKFDIRKVEVHRIVSCNGQPAEGAESVLRAELIKEYPQAFRKNDRFFGVDISPATFDKILAGYFG